MANWTPSRTPQEAEKILCAPGQMHELETKVIDDRLQRVYKNMPWNSLRSFWLWARNEYNKPEQIYAVHGNERYTFSQVFQMSVKAAALFRSRGIIKGDRIAVISRNNISYLVAFWAIQLIGGISVLINAWLPAPLLSYCLSHTGSKLVLLDYERANILERAEIPGSPSFLVFPNQENKSWIGMERWDHLHDYSEDRLTNITIVDTDPGITAECNATIMFTSGTTGLPKGVLSTQRNFLTNIFNTLVAGRRAALRRGEDIPPMYQGPQKGILISVPLFHVTGITSLAMLATLSGSKIVLMRKWEPEEAARLIRKENITIAGGVPSMVLDLLDSSAVGSSLEAFNFGGAPTPPRLAADAQKKFPDTLLSQGYGATETNSIATSVSGEDAKLPMVIGWPSPVNDVIIVKDNVKLPPGQDGEIWIRGPNVMKEYWNDPKATAKAITRDGYFKSGDRGFVDETGELRFFERSKYLACYIAAAQTSYIHSVKDIIIRGGENVDSISVESALYVDGVLEVGVVGVPDARLGERVAAVVSVKPQYRGKVTEVSLLPIARASLPRFAVPEMIIIQHEPLERTPSGKIIKMTLRIIAAAEWEKRKNKTSAKL